MSVLITTEIRCSPRELWPWLTEPERMKQWMKGLVSIEPGDASAMRPGAKAKMTIKEGGRLATYDETIVAWEPCKRIAVSLTGAHCKGVEIVCENRLEDLGGSTRLHHSFDCKTSSTVYKVLSFIFRGFAKMQAKGFLKRLKHLAEARPAAAAAAAAR
jgi:uncharacterized protein YndB with AHSA1/START domain